MVHTKLMYLNYALSLSRHNGAIRLNGTISLAGVCLGKYMHEDCSLFCLKEFSWRATFVVQREKNFM
jgi:hypothetical protein